MDRIFWQEAIQLLTVLGLIVVSLGGFFAMWKQTGNINTAFDKFTDKIVNNATITAGLEQRYDALPDASKVPVDLALDVIKWWTKLSPSEKDNIWGEWADELRDGVPVDTAETQAVKRGAPPPFKPVRGMWSKDTTPLPDRESGESPALIDDDGEPKG